VFGIDERDPLRYDVNPIEYTPSNNTIETLNLMFIFESQAKWVDVDNGNPAFIYAAWGDNRGDEHEYRPLYDENIRSKGWRLKITKEALKAFLNNMGLDLIVEIEISRRNGGYGYDRRYDKEEEKEARFDRVILLRRDGTIEAAEGSIGTWTTPGS